NRCQGGPLGPCRTNSNRPRPLSTGQLPAGAGGSGCGTVVAPAVVVVVAGTVDVEELGTAAGAVIAVGVEAGTDDATGVAGSLPSEIGVEGSARATTVVGLRPPSHAPIAIKTPNANAPTPITA